MNSFAARDPIPLPTFVSDATLLGVELTTYRNECLAPCIDTQDVADHFARLPADIATWGRVLGAAIAHATETESVYRRTHGELYAEFTERLTAIKGKASATRVESIVRADPQYAAAKTAVGKAEGLVAEVREILHALRRKGDALVSLGATRRTEYESQRIADSDRS